MQHGGRPSGSTGLIPLMNLVVVKAEDNKSGMGSPSPASPAPKMGTASSRQDGSPAPKTGIASSRQDGSPAPKTGIASSRQDMPHSRSLAFASPLPPAKPASGGSAATPPGRTPGGTATPNSGGKGKGKGHGGKPSAEAAGSKRKPGQLASQEEQPQSGLMAFLASL